MRRINLKQNKKYTKILVFFVNKKYNPLHFIGIDGNIVSY